MDEVAEALKMDPLDFRLKNGAREGTKAAHGHALGAAGALEAAVTALALARGFLPGQGPTRLEPGVPVRVLEEGRAEKVACAASLSLAFGGNDVALVLGRVDARVPT